MIENVFINIWNKRVGAIHWNQDSGIADFEFDPGFFQHKLDVTPLKIPVGAAKGKIFSFPELAGSSTFKGLSGLLADVLPDRCGNALINAWLARVGHPANSMNPVEMLVLPESAVWELWNLSLWFLNRSINLQKIGDQ